MYSMSRVDSVVLLLPPPLLLFLGLGAAGLRDVVGVPATERYIASACWLGR